MAAARIIDTGPIAAIFNGELRFWPCRSWRTEAGAVVAVLEQQGDAPDVKYGGRELRAPLVERYGKGVTIFERYPPGPGAPCGRFYEQSVSTGELTWRSRSAEEVTALLGGEALRPWPNESEDRQA